MKKALLTLLSVVIAPVAFAQGSFFYNNFTADGGTGFVMFGGNPAPTGYSIDIFWGTVGTAENALVALGSPVNVGELGPGYFDGGTAVIPVASGASVLIQYRVTTAGYIGRSAIVTQPIAFAPATPADPILPANWAITVVPEPSAFALAGMAGASLLIFRRRK